MAMSAFEVSVGAAETGLLMGVDRQSSGHLGCLTKKTPKLLLH